MTLVLDQKSDGPATHALVIGLEHPASDVRPLYSAALSAERIADLLLQLDIQAAPLASLDLLRSHSPFTKSDYANPRDGVSHATQPPAVESVRRAVLAWRERLDGDLGNIAFFYYVGPTVEVESQAILMIPASAPAAGSGVDFENLWTVMATSRASRQLYFVDGCPAGVVKGRHMPTALLARDGPGRTDLHRARYHGRVHYREAIERSGGPSLMTQALGEILKSGDSVSTRDLGRLLNDQFRKQTVKAGSPIVSEAASIVARFEGNFLFRYRASIQKRAARQVEVSAQQPPGEPAAEPEPEPRQQPNEPAAAKRAERRSAPGPADGAGGDSPLPDWARGLAGPNLGRLIARLTERQRLCLRLVRQGRSANEIASEIGRSTATVNRDLREATSILGFEAGDRIRAAGMLAFYENAIKGAVEPAAAMPADAAAAETGPAAATRSPAPEPNTHFVSDDPEVEHDALGRGPLAIALGRRLHRIWCRSNGIRVPGGEKGEAGGGERAAFVLHLDAPWGGGKTSFGNFLARVLNPFPAGCKGPANFLAERAGGTDAVGTIFIDDPPATEEAADSAAAWPEDARRPWIVVPFNAWQAEHCSPPWWVFYQAIRKGCFNAVWTEGKRASAPGQSTPPRRPSLAKRIGTWASLWAREIGWRLRNPKIMALLGTAAVAGALIVILSSMGIIFGGEDGPAFDAGNALGFLLAGVSGVSGLWALGALLTESVAPGTDAVAERRSLGGGDPFDRFRRHFARTMVAVKRPVMVIVDDLDRCRPDFVVDLVRGIQTLLRSPRVVFVILGDRDWIERAFEAHHDAMRKVNVGAEQTFGARFVEKAIQMSFILPEMPDARQDDYVRRVLLGPGADRAPADAPPPPPELAQQLRADYRETVAAAETAEDRQQAEQVLRHKYKSIFQTIGDGLQEASDRLFDYDASDYRAAPDAETAGAQADKLLGEERAMLAAVDERMGKALLHRLEPLARSFPPNPRQIKRIVNAITMYTCVAYLQMDMDETDERGVELAIWVIIMTEWPATWRLLAGCPDLVPAIAAENAAAARKALRAIDPTLLPGSVEATLEEIMRVRADARLSALIRGGGPAGAPALSVQSARDFRALTPLYAGKRKLAAEVAPSTAASGSGAGAKA